MGKIIAQTLSRRADQKEVLMSEFKYQVVIHWDEGDRVFVAEVPGFPGCQAHGSKKTEAVQKAEEAITLCVSTAGEDGIVVPEPKELQVRTLIHYDRAARTQGEHLARPPRNRVLAICSGQLGRLPIHLFAQS